MAIATNYRQLLAEIAEVAKACGRDPHSITLVAVSKSQPKEAPLAAYQAGCLDFGESRVQEALAKIEALPTEIRWHLIGALQKNKVNKVVGKFTLIHSVDSLELAQKLSEKSAALGMTTPILLQANTSGEQTKQGLTGEKWQKALEKLLELPGLSVRGMMTIAPLTDDKRVITRCFANLRKLSESLQRAAGSAAHFGELSMGMSQDWPIAIQEGATLLRIGTAIFQPGE